MSHDLDGLLEVGDSQRVVRSPREIKYPALHAITRVYRSLAVASALLALFGLMAVMSADIPTAIKAQFALPLIVYFLLGPVFLWGTAELILLLIDIETNTRRTCEAIIKESHLK